MPMARLTKNDKIHILAKCRELEQNGVTTPAALLRHLKAHARGILTRIPSKPTCARLLKKSRMNGDLSELAKDLPRDQSVRSGKFALITTNQRQTIIRKALSPKRPNHKRRCVHLATETHAGRQLSKTSVRNILTASGHRYYHPRANLALKEHHLSCRLRWAQQWVKQPPQYWEQFIFSDEKIFKLRPHPHRQNDGLWLSIHSTEDEKDTHLASVVDRHSTSVCFWGAAGYHGKLDPVIFNGIMTTEFYTENMIKGQVKPFMRKHKQHVRVFQQDGDRKHTSKEAVRSLNRNLGSDNWTHAPPVPCKETSLDGELVRHPKVCKDGKTRSYKIDATHCKCPIPEKYIHMAKSPDVAIAEHFWTWMVNDLKKRPPAKTPEEFKEMLRQSWADMPLAYVQSLVHSMPRRFRAVINAKGKQTKY